MRVRLILGLIMLFNLMASGQHYFSKNFTINDGLPSNSIKCIFKDSKERMWIATGAGLCQFDGQKFNVYGIKDGLPSENISSITEDSKQNLWIGCMKGGVSQYDGKTFTNYTTKNGLVSDNVRVVWYSSRFDLLFIGTNDGCNVFDGKQIISLTSRDSGIKDLCVMGFIEGVDFVNVYTYPESPLYRYYAKTKKFFEINDNYYQSHSVSTSPLVLNNGDTIIGNKRDGINILHNGLKKSFMEMGQVFDIKQGMDKDVWLACWSENSLSKEMPGGLFKYDGVTVTRFSEQFGIYDPTVWSLFYDTIFNILWVGTLNSGLYKIPIPAFENYDATDFHLAGLNVLSLLSTKSNDLWIGTNGHLIRHSKEGGFTVMDNSLAQKVIGDYRLEYFCIKEDRQGNVYTTLYQSSLIKYSKANNYRKPSFLRLKPGCTKFAFDTHDTIFYGDKWWDGIFRCSLYSKGSKPIRWLFNENNAPQNVNKIISSGDTIWYISQTEGLFLTCKGRIEYFRKTNPSIPRILNDICFDRSGNVIIGSNTGEVLILRYMADSLYIKYRFAPDKEIIGNTVKYLVVDNTNHLYVGTNLGLNRIDLKRLYESGEVITNFYSTEVGYFDHTGKVAECDKDGNLWIGTDNHLIRVDTKLLERFSGFNPSILINGLDINFTPDKDFSPDTFRKFPYAGNNLIFHYTVKNYLNPEQTLFRFKLIGLFETWSEYSSENKVVFNSLPPGSYKLLVESNNPLDNSQTSTATFSFKIRYPWFLNGWFIGLTVILLITITIFIFRQRTNRIKHTEQQKAEYTRKLAQIEMRALQSQMNPHFIFNSINSIQGFIINNHVDEAREYLMDFARLIRQTLDNATREFISLEEELDYLKYYLKLELMRFDRKFIVDIRVPEDMNPQNIQLPPMLIQPYVENAIRHGLVHNKDCQGLLVVEFGVEDDRYLKCTIEDNGVGRKKSKEIESWKTLTHKPQSTRITQDRIELLNLSSQSVEYKVNIIDLVNNNDNPKGTRVELLLPLRTL